MEFLPGLTRESGNKASALFAREGRTTSVFLPTILEVGKVPEDFLKCKKQLVTQVRILA